MNKFLSAAVLAASLGAMSGAAQAHDWAGTHREWVPHNTCSLRLDRVYQSNSGQPIHLVITNTGSTRVRYDVQITLRQGGRDVFTGTTSVDNANANESSTRGTSNGFSGTLTDSRISLRVTSCAIRTS